MKVNYAWRSTGWLLVLCLVTLALLASCGGNKGLNGGGDGQQVSDTAGGAASGEALTITEDEIGSLPAWQQELLADPGWNQPPIPQRPDTPMPAPSHEMLLEWQQDALANPGAIVPRGTDGKSASWTGGHVPGNSSIQRGEFDITCNPDDNQDVVPYGCEDDDCTNGHAMDAKISLEPLPDANRAISFVELGIASGNHFTGAGGSNNLALCAVYQLWSSIRSGDPTRDYYSYNPPGDPRPEFAEISYRADGGPGAGGDPCNAASAYTVEKFIWWKYNMETNALPGGNKTPIYNILIAPSSDIQPEGESDSPNKTLGQIQHFYCGNLGAAYGGGAIVTLNSSESSCDTFKNGVTDSPLFFTNPIYGVLLKRWEDSVLDSMNAPENKPWDGDFGWPVQGPVPYNNGAATLTGNGAYYAWGMYFERGFIWWVDYVNNANVPDEAQAYTYTGANVFCKGATDKYEKLPTIYYGGSGALGVSVIVEASLNPSRGPGSPPAGSFYEVANPADPNPPLLLDMHAHGYGGEPRASDGAYKHYTWAFRDGTIGVTNGTPYDDSTKYLTHSYATQAVYTIRVQVVDSDDNIGYGDSLPIHVGQGGGGGDGEIWLIRMDGGTYNTNFNAIKTSLDTVGASYTEKTFSATTATDFASSTAAKVAVFYRGGPSGSEANLTTPMTQAQYDAMRTILNSGSKRKVLFISQNHATADPTSSPYHYYYPFRFEGPGYWYYFELQKGLPGYTGSAIAPTANYLELEEKIDGQQAHPLMQYSSSGSNYYQGMYNYLDPGQYNNYGFLSMRATSWVSQLPFLGFGSYATSAAERYVGAGSSGKVPTSMAVNQARQYTMRGRWTFSSSPYNQRNAGWIAGLGVEKDSGFNTTFRSQALVSYGNSTAPGLTAGTGKFWVIGYSWNDATVTGGTASKHDVLRNVLAWLDSGLTFAAKTNTGFQEYSGPPEILSVTPAYWQNQSYVAGGNTTPWNGTSGQYPDQTGSDAYRTSGGYANAILTSDPNNNWINGNDVDFQHPMYGYIDDGGDGVEEGAGNIGSTNDTVFYAGLLLDDQDNSWDRYTPADTPSIVLEEEQNNTMNRNPRPAVAGYFATTGSGGTLDDVHARYGSQIEAFDAVSASWDNIDPLQVECLAHWPQTLKYFNWSGPGGQAPNAPDAYLVWQVYPGQSIKVQTGPDAGKFVGLNVGWNAYLANFDIDPSATVAGRDGSPWNRPTFSFRDDPTQGRAISFNFRKVNEWNGDINRDGTIDNDDKFPVRVRLFTEHQTYWTKVVNPAGTPGWPNHLADAGGNPATTPPASRNPTFIEAGTYVVDHGSPVYKVQITDDPNQPDPGAQGTLSGQGPGSYEAELKFLIKYGNPNYKIEADTWYTGSWGANGGAPIVLVKAAADPPNTEGAYDIEIPVPAAQLNGYYTFAIRVTDANNDVSTYVWPTQVGLFPQALVDEDFEGGNLNQWTISGTQGSNYLGTHNMNFDWKNVTSAPYNNHPIYYYSGNYGGTMNPPQGSRMGVWGDTGTNTIGPAGADRYLTLTNNVSCTPGQVYSFSWKTNGISYPTSSTSTYAYGSISPEVSWDGGSTWTRPTSSSGANSWSGAKYNYSYYFWPPGYYMLGYASNAPQAGGQWITRSFTLTASGSSFKIRFRVLTYSYPFGNPSSYGYYGVCSPMAIDEILVQ